MDFLLCKKQVTNTGIYCYHHNSSFCSVSASVGCVLFGLYFPWTVVLWSIRRPTSLGGNWVSADAMCATAKLSVIMKSPSCHWRKKSTIYLPVNFWLEPWNKRDACLPLSLKCRKALTELINKMNLRQLIIMKLLHESWWTFCRPFQSVGWYHF